MRSRAFGFTILLVLVGVLVSVSAVIALGFAWIIVQAVGAALELTSAYQETP